LLTPTITNTPTLSFGSFSDSNRRSQMRLRSSRTTRGATLDTNWSMHNMLLQHGSAPFTAPHRDLQTSSMLPRDIAWVRFSCSLPRIVLLFFVSICVVIITQVISILIIKISSLKTKTRDNNKYGGVTCNSSYDKNAHAVEAMHAAVRQRFSLVRARNREIRQYQHKKSRDEAISLEKSV
jgi:hypothetical protein